MAPCKKKMFKLETLTHNEETNKDKSLGEVSAELNDYLIEIKELVESNEISYDELKEEIRKHLKSKDKVKPGSVAQLLMARLW